MRSPIIWFGGKGNMVEKLLKHIPQHHTYVEVFGGGASLLFAKQPSKVEVYNDLDSGLVGLFRVLKDPRKFKKFYRLVQFTPYSREEYIDCRATWKGCDDEIERAYRWYVTARMSLSGRLGSGWGYNRTSSVRGMAETCSRWLSIIELLPQIHARMMQIQIDHDDFPAVIDRYDTSQTFFYCDPPYPLTTRKSGGYQHEMIIEDHAKLVDCLLRIQGTAMLSCYYHEVYYPLVAAGWQRHDYNTACHAAGKTRGSGLLGKGAATFLQPRIETMLIKPGGPREQGRLF